MARMPFKRKKEVAEDPAILQREIDTVLRILANYPPDTTLSFGAPVRCPMCANFGLVEHLDRERHVTQNRCVSCGNEWIVSARALRAARETMAASLDPVGVTGFLDDLQGGTLPSGGMLFTRDDDGEVARELVSLSGLPLRTEPALAVHEQNLAVPERGPMRILLVEDDPSDIAVVRALLDPAGPEVIDLRWAQTRAAGEAAALDEQPDLVLLDLGLPDSHGLQTVTRWHFNAIDAPVLIVSGDYGSDVVDRGAELGVSGYLHKDELADLLAAGDEGASAFLDRLESAVTT